MAELSITERSASHGVFAPNHHLRAAIVPAGAITATDSSRPASRRRLDWASHLKRVFATDVLDCDACGGAMRILAILPEGDASRTILEHLDLPTAPPCPARSAHPNRDATTSSPDRHRCLLRPLRRVGWPAAPASGFRGQIR